MIQSLVAITATAATTLKMMKRALVDQPEELEDRPITPFYMAPRSFIRDRMLEENEAAIAPVQMNNEFPIPEGISSQRAGSYFRACDFIPRGSQGGSF